MAPSRPQNRDAIGVAIICALSLEADIVCDVLDEVWDNSSEDCKYGKASGDTNSYTIGAIGDHNVVLAHMPGMGTIDASIVASNVRFSFPNVTLALVVGICGGVPNVSEHDQEIHLGDLIISSGLIRYDFGRQHSNTFERKDTISDNLSRPSLAVRGVLAKLQTRQYRQTVQKEMLTWLRLIQAANPATSCPGTEHDQLYPSSVVHKHRNPRDCHICDESPNSICVSSAMIDCHSLGCEIAGQILRERPTTNDSISMSPNDPIPEIHVGVMGSGNTVMKSAVHRDQIALKDGIIAFEMEGAGIWEQFSSCIIIKGVCDYADSHKNSEWQLYAAAVAAAGMKAFLKDWTSETYRFATSIPVRENNLASGTKPSPGMSSAVDADDNNADNNSKQNKMSFRMDVGYEGMYTRMSQLSLPIIPMQSFEWIWSTPFDSWLRQPPVKSSVSSSFWITGKPGSGKSTLMKFLVDAPRTRTALDKIKRGHKIIHFFFDYRAGTSFANNEYGVIRMFISQLCDHSFLTEKRLELRNLWDPISKKDLETLTDLLCNEIDNLSYPICAFVDGLDEYAGDFTSLMQRLLRIQNRTQIKMCFASRPEMTFQRIFADLPKLTMEDHNSSSILAYIDHAIGIARDLDFDAADFFDKSLRNELLRQAHGVMIWVRLAVDEIIRTAQTNQTKDNLRAVLQQLPENLEEMYDRTFSRIPSSDAREAALLLTSLNAIGGVTHLGILYGIWDLMFSEVIGALPTVQCSSKTAFLTQLRRLLGPFIDIINISEDQLYADHLENRAYKKREETVLGLKTKNPKNLSSSESLEKSGGVEYEIRFMHKTVQAYLQRSLIIRSSLPRAFSERYPNAIISRMCADVMRRALELHVFDFNLLEEIQKGARAKLQGETWRPSFNVHYLTLKEMIVEPSWVIRLRFLARSIMWFPITAHRQQSDIANVYGQWTEILESPILFLDLESRIGTYHASEMFREHHDHIALRLAIEYGLSDYLQEALVQEPSLSSALFNNLLSASVRVLWEDGLPESPTRIVQELQPHPDYPVLQILTTRCSSRRLGIGIGRLHDIIQLILPRCDAMSTDLLRFIMIFPTEKMSNFDQRIEIIYALLYSMKHLPLSASTDPAPNGCCCERRDHIFGYWLSLLRNNYQTFRAGSLEIGHLYMLISHIAMQNDTIASQPCAVFGDAFHLTLTGFSSLNMERFPGLMATIILLAKLKVDPTIRHENKTPLEASRSEMRRLSKLPALWSRVRRARLDCLTAIIAVFEHYDKHSSWPDFSPLIEQFGLQKMNFGSWLPFDELPASLLRTSPIEEE